MNPVGPNTPPAPVPVQPPVQGLAPTPKPKQNWGLVVLISVVGGVGIVAVLLLAAFVLGRSTERSTDSSAASKSGTVVNDQVSTSCYEYTVPTGYIGAVADNSCKSGANISKEADDLTAIVVSPVTSKITGDPVTYLKETLKKAGDTKSRVTAITVDGQPAAKAIMKSEGGVYPDKTYIIVPAPSGNVWEQNGTKIYSYSISAYTEALDEDAFSTVVDSIQFKTPTKDGASV